MSVPTCSTVPLYPPACMPWQCAGKQGRGEAKGQAGRWHTDNGKAKAHTGKGCGEKVRREGRSGGPEARRSEIERENEGP